MSFRLDPSALSRPSTRRAMAQFPYRRPSVASDAPDNPPAPFTPPPSRDNFSTYSQTSWSSSRMVSVPETPVIYRSMVPIRPLEDWRDMTGIAVQTAAGDVQEVGGKSMAAGTSFPSLPSSSSLSLLPPRLRRASAAHLSCWARGPFLAKAFTQCCVGSRLLSFAFHCAQPHRPEIDVHHHRLVADHLTTCRRYPAAIEQHNHLRGVSIMQ
ncbi:hypothetical protein B0H13DRAFT_2565675 [Mycena leptocephala]|nr:hypothetical protein B0H13DRAFT_2565675 [Mycena leptocephala]